jgi:hypothetical protein
VHVGPTAGATGQLRRGRAIPLRPRRRRVELSSRDCLLYFSPAEAALATVDLGGERKVANCGGREDPGLVHGYGDRPGLKRAQWPCRGDRQLPGQQPVQQSGDIALDMPAADSQSLMLAVGGPRPPQRSDDGQAILRPVRTDPVRCADLVLLVGATGFERVTPRL